MATHQRRREIGVWRALGATRKDVAVSFALQAGVLALVGGAAGAVFSVLAVYLFRDHLVDSLGVPLMIPAAGTIALLALGGLAVAVAVATGATVVPALNTCREDPALAMRE
jgi:putative ABC transport system permease protein